MASNDTSFRATWDAGQLSYLCEMRGANYTFGKIADDLDMTRGAVIGRYDRLMKETKDFSPGNLDVFAEFIEHDFPFEFIARRFFCSVAAVEARFAEMRRRLGPQAI